MKMKYFTQLALAVFLLCTLTVNAQRQCATMEVLEQQMQQNPQIQLNMDRIEQMTRDYVRDAVENRADDEGQIVTIPVIVHVVLNSDVEREAAINRVASQIQVLNEDFLKLNTNAGDTKAEYADRAADTRIAFVLDRVLDVQTEVTSFGTDNSVKFSSSGGSDVISPDQYLNMWVCNIGGGILGYAQFPGGSANTDGVVIDHQYFGVDLEADHPYNLGRTATHEVGHWLNLRHIWGDGPCSYDDFVDDTPIASGPNYSCDLTANSCREKGRQPAEYDMVQNYMDYTNDACMTLFTTGQKSRMRAVFFGTNAPRAGFVGGTPPPPPAVEICDNNIDDDGDGKVDCADGDCAFSTACQEPGNCPAPLNLSTSYLGKDKGKFIHGLSWDPVSEANSYYVEVYQSGTSNVVASGTISSNGASLSISRGTYDWAVRSNCTGSSSEWSARATFTAGSATARLVADLPVSTAVFPNPARDRIVVQFQEASRWSGLPDLTTGEVRTTSDTYIVRLHDLTGRLLRNQVTDAAAGTLELNVGDLSPGLYFLRISDRDGELMSSHKVVLQP